MEYLSGKEVREAERWMEEAATSARMALCRRARCGTVIVQDSEVIGRGYNAPPCDKEEHRVCGEVFPAGKPKYDKTCCIHAEWRAIMDALTHYGDRVRGADLYFVRVDEGGAIKKSQKPFCTVCSRLALDAGLTTFHLWHEEGVGRYETGEYNRLSYEYEHNVVE